MKNSIGFKHFRKFEDFPKLDFNDITFVVGKNNSGKSTFVKAFVMVYNYLKSGNLKQLDLNQGSVELLNIVTFDRALCKTMSERENKEYIPITLKLGNYEFYLNITGKKDSTILDVANFKITDTSSFFTVQIDPQKEHAIVSYSYSKVQCLRCILIKLIKRISDKLYVIRHICAYLIVCINIEVNTRIIFTRV